MSHNIAFIFFGVAAATLLQEAAGASSDATNCNGAPGLDYNLDLAISSVFVILVISFLGAAFPALLALRRHPYLVLSIKFGSFAGSGVLLATGFVHMLLSAYESLSSPCLSDTWLGLYPAWGFLFTVITIVCLQVLDYILLLVYEPNPLDPSLSMIPSSPALEGAAVTTRDVERSGPPSASAQVDSEPTSEEHVDCNKHVRCKDEECSGRTLLPLPSPAKRRAMGNLVMSEISVGVHSVIIGLALGATPSSQFTALFIAIIFHQLLEGIALGSNASQAGVSARMIVWLAIIYSFTTPIGIAIGIGVQSTLNTNSAPMLLTTGVLESISAGTLIFLSLGDHMNAMKSQAGWLRAQSLAVQCACILCFFVGAGVMLAIAIWA